MSGKRRDFTWKAWQHNVVPLPPLGTRLSAVCDALDEYGQEGWELVSVVDGYAYFKRQHWDDYEGSVPVDDEGDADAP